MPARAAAWALIFAVAVALATLTGGVASAVELRFPALTGRVVDGAGLLTPAEEQRLTERLAAHERATTNQVVVVTLPSLQGTTIEDFGYRLGRHWALGQAGKDNGAILLVAPKERAVRIEVGYGLEPELTDAQSKLIIENIILPAFRDGRFGQGITAATDAILRALQGEATSTAAESGPAGSMAPRPTRDAKPAPAFDPSTLWFFIIAAVVVVVIMRNRYRAEGDDAAAHERDRRGPRDGFGPGGWTSDGSWTPSGRSGGFGRPGRWGGSWGGGIGRRSAGAGRRSGGSRSSGGGGGSFGGGGGSFGGGGASGRW